MERWKRDRRESEHLSIVHKLACVRVNMMQFCWVSVLPSDIVSLNHGVGVGASTAGDTGGLLGPGWRWIPAITMLLSAIVHFSVYQRQPQ